MAYDARQIANEILKIADEEGIQIGLMKLLKLIFFAHGWNLAIHGRPLIKQAVNAWQYGPVVNDVYFGFRKQHVTDLTPLKLRNGQEIDQDTRKIISDTLRTYGHEAPFILSDLTHIEGGPWDETIRTRGRGKKIPNELIKRHFDNKLRLAQENEQRTRDPAD